MNAISESALWKKRLGDWVLNPYIGCEHGCIHCYCPAMPGVKFFNGKRPPSDWGKYLIPKPGFVAALKRQLRTFTPADAKRTEWGDGWLLMSFLTDCYTPSEAKFKTTRECLKLLLEAGHKVRVQTRSALVERDFDILRAHRDRVLLGTSLPYLDDKLARVLEPKATGPTRRLNMLEKAASLDIPIYTAVAPVMPFKDGGLDFLKVISTIKELPNRQVFCEVLNPKGDNIPRMAEALTLAGDQERAAALGEYNHMKWSLMTLNILKLGWEISGSIERYPINFIPWPDTGRGWKNCLRPDQVAWLDQFLPS